MRKSQKEITNRDRDSALKPISRVSFVLIVLGYLNLFSYYTYFDIPISNYITPTELVLSFTGYLLPRLVSIRRLIVRLLFLFFITELKSLVGISVRNFISTPPADERRYIAGIILFCGLLFLIISLYILYIKTHHPDQFSASLDNFFLIYIVFEIILGFMLLKLRLKPISLVTILVVIFVFYMFSANYILYLQVAGGRPLYNVSFKAGSQDIATDNNLIFIGRTNGYIFLRDRKQEKNMIFKQDNVDSIEFSEIHSK